MKNFFNKKFVITALACSLAPCFAQDNIDFHIGLYVNGLQEGSFNSEKITDLSRFKQDFDWKNALGVLLGAEYKNYGIEALAFKLSTLGERQGFKFNSYNLDAYYRIPLDNLGISVAVGAGVDYSDHSNSDINKFQPRAIAMVEKRLGNFSIGLKGAINPMSDGFVNRSASLGLRTAYHF